MDIFNAKYSNPYLLFKQLCTKISNCSTHQDALNTLDLIKILTLIVDESKYKLGTVDPADKSISDEYDLEFYSKNNLIYFFSRTKSDWHLSLNRFTSILPSTNSKSDQLLYSNSFETIYKMLYLQANNYDQKFDNLKPNNMDQPDKQQLYLMSMANSPNENNIDKWLFNMIYCPNSSLLEMIKHFLLTYETDEIRIRYKYLSFSKD